MKTIELIIDGCIAVVSLDRQEKFNSFNREMTGELLEVLKIIESRTDIRCVVLTGKGKAFCAGQDLGEAIDKDGPGLERILKDGYNPLIQAMRNLPLPIVCAVNGVAAGAGANIALACDLLVASENAIFIQAFTKIGLIPDSGGTYFLPKIIGTHRAMAQMLLADKVSASEAKDMGLVYAVYASETFMDETMKLAKRLADMPTQAIAFTKQAVYAGWNNTLDEQLSLELQLQIKAGNTADHKEGIAAFLEKRTPQFSGK
jgi:2-(1,2-epoxy-1,2-dihydrophenyl)acetyl-CoA isomerase